MLANILLFSGLAGLASSTIFLLLVALAAIRHRWRHYDHGTAGAVLSKVALLKPLCGLEPDLELNLETFFLQDYPSFEIIFGARHSSHPALEVVHALRRRYPPVKAKVVLSGEPNSPNAKVRSLEKMCAAASGRYLVISDSDVRVDSGYLQAVISPLLDEKVGMVTCLYRGVPTGGIWSRLEALGMSVEMASGVIVADMLEGMRFALGPTMAIRRDVLDATGGLRELADYCADDYVLGQKVHQLGWKVALSRYVIDHVVISREFQPSILHQIRWMKSTRFSRGLALIGTGLTFATPYGFLAAAGALIAQHPALAMALIGWAVTNRILMALISGWGVVRDPRALRDCWLYPVRDLMGFCFWCASFIGDTVVWRQDVYRLEPGGKMKRIEPSAAEKPESEAVAVDNLA